MSLPQADNRGDRWSALARYNAEQARGIVHTPEWNERMATEQAEFDREQDYDHPFRLKNALGEEIERFATSEEMAAYMQAHHRPSLWRRLTRARR